MSEIIEVPFLCAGVANETWASSNASPRAYRQATAVGIRPLLRDDARQAHAHTPHYADHPRAAWSDLISFLTFHISTARSVASQPAPPFAPPAAGGEGADGADMLQAPSRRRFEWHVDRLRPPATPQPNARRLLRNV